MPSRGGIKKNYLNLTNVPGLLHPFRCQPALVFGLQEQSLPFADAMAWMAAEPLLHKASISQDAVRMLHHADGIVYSHLGLLQWGNTYTMVARKHLDDAAADGRPISDVLATVEEQWAKVSCC